MSTLKPGTLCVIIAGCPENIGVIVEVIRRIGRTPGYTDCYHIRTASGRPFKQLWADARRRDAFTDGPNPVECFTDRHKLRPLVAPNEKAAKKTKAADPPARGKVICRLPVVPAFKE